MQPIIFQTLPPIFSFVTVALLIEVSMLLLATGRKYLKAGSYVIVGITTAVLGEGTALAVFPSGAWIAIAAGAVGGVALCRFLRPVGVGISLAFLAFYGATYLVEFEYIQFVAALVLFAYGLLLTDLAPTFVSSLLASSIFFLSGAWVGIPTPILITVVLIAGAARVLLTIVPSRMLKGQTPAFRANRR